MTQRRERQMKESVRKIAHDSGDGETIYHCPFCLVGTTKYLTRDGVKTFAETVNTTQWVLTADANDRTGGRWVEAHIHEFGEQPVLKIILRRNKRTMVIEATPEHRWLVKSNRRKRTVKAGISRKGKPRDWRPTECAQGHEFTEATTRVKKNGTRECLICAAATVPVGGASRATDRDVLTRGLRPGMRLSHLRQAGVGDLAPDEAGIRHGVVFGDGSAQGKSATVTLWGEKDKQLLAYFPDRRYFNDNTASRALGTGVPGVRVSGDLWAWMKAIPEMTETPRYLYGWLAGYFAADGTVSKQGQVQITSANLAHLEAVRDIALRLGIATYGITHKQRVGFKGREPSSIYTLDFVTSTLNEEFFLIEAHRDRYCFRDYGYERLGWTVVSVEETGRVEPVYCAVVPGTHSFVLDGHIWTGNCGSGQVIARSDRSIECEFCHQNFTVQVQPQYPAFPQTIDGMPVQVPGMPGQINANDPGGLPPVDPGAVGEDGEVPPNGDEETEGDEGFPPNEEEDSEDDDEDAPPWAKKSSLLVTTAGHRLPPEEYVRHLAIRYAADRKDMAARIKEERRA